MQSYELLEAKLAEWMGLEKEQMIVCSSGSAALYLALESLDIAKDSLCLVPDYSYIACGRAAVDASLRPVFVDCGNDLCMNRELPVRWWLKQPSDARPPSAVVVHMQGRIARVPAIDKITWIEDLSQAHSLAPSNRADASCWSFHGSKIIAGEEGGAVHFREPWAAKRARLLRNQGHSPTDTEGSYIRGGGNYRMANALALPILESLGKFDENIKRRRELEGLYEQVTPTEWRMPERQVPWVYDIMIPGLSTYTREAIIKTLGDWGIKVRRGFRPLSTMPEFLSYEALGKGEQARRAFWSILCLPLEPEVTKDMPSKIISTILTLVG